MKTAISIPDHVFQAAEELARRLGKSRSELYSAAIASYLERHRQDRVTERLNEVYGPCEERAELDPVLAALQSLSMAEEEWYVRRGEVWWAALRPPLGSGPGPRRPVLVQSDPFNRSRIDKVIAAAVTSNLRLHGAPGNVLLPRGTAGLDRDSVFNVSQTVTIDKTFLSARVGRISLAKQRELDDGLRLVLAL